MERSEFPHLNDSQFEPVRKMGGIFGRDVFRGLASVMPAEQVERVNAFDTYERELIAHVQGNLQASVAEPKPVQPKRLRLAVPAFEGKEGENLHFWIREVEIAMRAGLISDQGLRVAFALSNLSGRAKNWAYTLETMSPGCFASWEQFPNTSATHVARADCPHLSEPEWEALQRLSTVIGEAAVATMLRTLSPTEQHGVALGFIVKEQRETAARTSVSPSATPRVESLKLHVSSYVGREGEPLLRWLVEVDTAIAARRIVDPLSKVAFAMSCLGGRARSWAYGRRLTDPTCFSTYEEFKEELKLAFEPPQNEFRSRAEFLDLQQGKHDVHAYAQRARYLVSNIVTNPIDEATKVVTFMKGLRDGPVRTYLFREYPNTLEAAIALAMQEEFSLRQAKLHVNAPRPMPRPVVRPSGGPEPMDLSSATAAGSQQRRGSTNGPAGAGRPAGDAVERVDIGHAAMKIAAPSESQSHCKKQDDKPNLVILKKEFVDELIVLELDDMVLGMPWLARHDPVIDWTKRTIVRFGSSSSATESDGPVGAAHAPRGACGCLRSPQANANDCESRWKKMRRGKEGASALGANAASSANGCKRPAPKMLASSHAAGLHDEAVRDQAGLERVRPRVEPAGEYKEQLSTAGPGQEETRGAGLRTRSERRKREKLRKSRSGTETLQAVSAGQTQELETTVETLSVLTRTSIGLQYKKMRLDNPPTLASELMSLPVTSWKRFARELHDGRIERICVLSDVERMTAFAPSKKERFDEQGWDSLKASPFYKVLRDYKDILPDDIPAELPQDKGVQHEIDLVPGTKYCVTRQWPLPRQVRESKSPHSAPTFCVKKPQGGWRIVHAYNKLNDATVPAQPPIPRKDVIIDSMTSSTIFSTLDLRDGFYQILMLESNIPLTAVSTPSGMLWEWLVMSQGLKNAPATFNSRAVNGKSDVEMHTEHLRKLLELMRKHKLYANLKKCIFGATEIPVLGCLVGKNGELRQFLGLATYLCKYVSNYAGKIRPLSQLLKKEAAWEWTAGCQQAFEAVKQGLTEAPILAVADQDRPFHVLSMSTAGHPQTDGQTERVNRVLVDTMKSYAHSFRQWSDCLSMAEFAINNSVHVSTGHTPFYVNAMRHPRVPSVLGAVAPSAGPAANKEHELNQGFSSDAMDFVQRRQAVIRS
uniref:Uncharacterized protein n=1 Tax=Phytophthora ramorum TaxID=164328 RepID=H3GQK7_PHYRM